MWGKVRQAISEYCQTQGLGLGLGVDFTFPNNNKKKKNNNKNPNLIFHRGEGTRGLKIGTQTYLTIISSGLNFPRDICP